MGCVLVVVYLWLGCDSGSFAILGLLLRCCGFHLSALFRVCWYNIDFLDWFGFWVVGLMWLLVAFCWLVRVVAVIRLLVIWLLGYYMAVVGCWVWWVLLSQVFANLGLVFLWFGDFLGLVRIGLWFGFGFGMYFGLVVLLIC